MSAAAPSGAATPSAGTRPTPTEQRLAELGALLVVSIWALNFIVVKLAIREVPPVAFAFVRFTLAAAVLLTAARLVEGSLRIPWRDRLPLMGLGALGFGLYQVLWTHGLLLTTAGASSLLIATTPVFTMLLSGLAGSDSLSRHKLVGAAISFGGVAAIIAAGAGISLGARSLGELLTLGASILWAAYLAFGSPFLRRHTPLLTTSWAMVGGSLALAPLGIGELLGMDWARVQLAGFAVALGISGLLAAALSNVIFFRAISVLGPTRVANFQFLIPALALGLAAVVLAEPVEPGQLVGGAAIVAGILVARRDPGRPRHERVERSPIEAELIEPA